ncbi:anaerobic glycerol-3-phosphate dehydrogenase subunit B [Halobacteriales archaeon SW_10_68_16]|nr:MAG: anaerobic glycerol-3-phosphate dehydrogenase subunit B [Halobacteriales archaeon SW_10_68_16]
MTPDVVVVGGGLAGSTAALAAARARPGADVVLVPQPDRDAPWPGNDLGDAGESAVRSSFASASGLVEVLGKRPDRDGFVTDPFAALDVLPPSHPYSVVGPAALREALALFDDVTVDRYGGDGTDTNAPLATDGATLYFPEGTYLVNGLSVGFPADIEAGPGPVDRTPLSCADRLDAAEEESDSEEATNAVVDGIVEALDVHLGTKDRAGFPAVLGLDHPDRIRERLADRLGVRVFEVGLGPPSVPGMRLGGLFADALADAGVDILPGTVEGVATTTDRVDRIDVDGTQIKGDAFVLATGGVADGGLVAGRDGVREPVFGCRVDVPDDRAVWTDRRPVGDHAFARFGVDFDDVLRPLGGRGAVAFENLRVAGRLLGGHDYTAETSGSGIAIATGYVAGRDATRN